MCEVPKELGVSGRCLPFTKAMNDDSQVNALPSLQLQMPQLLPPNGQRQLQY